MSSPLHPRIAVFLPNWIGDVVMATPFLRAIRTHYGPSAEILGLMRPYTAEVLAGTEWLSEIVPFERKPREANTLNQFQLVRKLRALKLDAAILLTNSIRTGALAWLSGAKRRIGYARDWRGWMLTDRLAPPKNNGRYEPISAIEYYLALAEKIGCRSIERRMELALTHQEKLAGERVWRNLALPEDRPVFALHAAGGGNGTASAKAWPTERFAELAAKIVAQTEGEVLVLCGPNERDTAREIARLAASNRVKSLADQELGIGLTKACLARSRMLVSTDSGPRHLAAALDRPVIGLFGATDPRWAETFHPLGTTIFNKTDCGPCGKKHCPLKHHACMRELSVERVWNAVQSELARGESHRSAA